jgi:fructan beta-fructosidase
MGFAAKLQYFVGDFDGDKFNLDPDFAYRVSNGRGMYLDYGRDNYAGVTWSDIPASDGRRLFIGWMSNWDYAQKVPTPTWRSAATLPRQLSLRRTDRGLQLFSEPVKELQALRIGGQAIQAGMYDKAQNFAPNIVPSQMELELEVELPARGEVDFGIELLNSKGEKYRIGYSSGWTNGFHRQFCPRTPYGAPPRQPKDHAPAFFLRPRFM